MVLLFQWFLDKLDSRLILFMMIGLPLAVGTVLLIILVGETSRLRAMEYSQRLARGIWEEGDGASGEIPWDLEAGEERLQGGGNPQREKFNTIYGDGERER